MIAQGFLAEQLMRQQYAITPKGVLRVVVARDVEDQAGIPIAYLRPIA